MAIELKKFVYNIKALRASMPIIVKNLLTGTEAISLINANIEAWNKGQLPNGEIITNKFTGTTEYSQKWGEIRQNEGMPTDHYYLQFSGKFAKSLLLSVQINKFVVSLNILQKGQDMKEDDLTAMFGDIIGIPNEAFKSFFDWFYVELYKEIELKLLAP
jgi:hypothetical protein